MLDGKFLSWFSVWVKFFDNFFHGLFFDSVKGLPVHFLNLLHILVWLRHNFNLTPLNQVPGKVLKAELENENGYLVYGVEIVKADKQIADVKVDAGNGKILKVDVDQKDHNVHEVHGEDSDNEREEVSER